MRKNLPKKVLLRGNLRARQRSRLAARDSSKTGLPLPKSLIVLNEIRPTSEAVEARFLILQDIVPPTQRELIKSIIDKEGHDTAASR